MSTADLITRLAADDASAWEAIVAAHGTRLWAVARAASGELAADAYQEALIAIRRSARRFRAGSGGDAAALGWLVTIAHRSAVGLVRRESRRRRRESDRMPNPPTAPTADRSDDDAGLAHRALSAVDELPERHRRVLELRVLAGLATADVAAALGCPEAHVRVRLSRALTKLRDRLGPAAAAMSVATLEQHCLGFVAPPPVLPPDAVAAAHTAASTPIAGGLATSGVVMAVTAASVAASAAMLLSVNLHHAPAMELPAAAPSSTAVVAAPAAAADAESAIGSLGLRTMPLNPRLAAELSYTGSAQVMVLDREAPEGSTADLLRPLDVIERIAGTAIASPQEVVDCVETHAGADLAMRIVRRGQPIDLSVHVASMPLSRHLNLDFEAAATGGVAAPGAGAVIPSTRGWVRCGYPGYTLDIDRAVAHGGGASARMTAGPDVGNGFGGFMGAAPVSVFRGTHVRLSGWMKGDAVGDNAALWLRADTPHESDLHTFANMMDQHVNGTFDWQRYEIEIDVPADTTHLAFGCFLAGSGTLWADDLRLEVVSDLPKADVPDKKDDF